MNSYIPFIVTRYAVYFSSWYGYWYLELQCQDIQYSRGRLSRFTFLVRGTLNVYFLYFNRKRETAEKKKEYEELAKR